MSAKTALLIAFLRLGSAITAVAFVVWDSRDVGLDIGAAPDWQAGCRAAFRERLSAI